ncbi:nicotinate (nicotinamide) nucleotide adenylyltransferase [bacterium]|nr:nicotinate (nicotinamide) nucleotide adenylyltransferase [bacterium]
MSRIGVFGGSFDPPHVGHLQVARQAADQLGLDRVLWIPALQSPFKVEGQVEDAAHRIAMVNFLVEMDPRFHLDLRDVNRPGPSYTVDTLLSLASEFKLATLFLIIGEDSYDGLPRWKDSETIRSLAQVVVYRRESQLGVKPAIRSTYQSAPDVLLSGEPVFCSSSEIRELVSKKNPIDHLVPAEVATYIQANRLYLEF